MGDLVDPFLDAGEGTGSDSFVGKDAEPAKGKLSGAYGWHGCPEQEGPQDRREPGLRCGGETGGIPSVDGVPCIGHDRAGGHVQSGKQGRGAVAEIIIGIALKR